MCASWRWSWLSTSARPPRAKPPATSTRASIKRDIPPLDGEVPPPGGGGRVWLVAAVSAGLLLGSLDAYVVAGVLLPMVTDLGVPLEHLERATPIVSGFLFGFVTAIPLFGPLSDARGRVAVYAGA